MCSPHRHSPHLARDLARLASYQSRPVGPRPRAPYRSPPPPPPDSISRPFAAIRSSDQEEYYGVQAAPNHVLADNWADEGLSDHATASTLIGGKHDGQRDPDAVHAVPSTPPAKQPRCTARSPARYLPARELQARGANCASPVDTSRDDSGAARTLAGLRKRVDELEALDQVC